MHTESRIALAKAEVFALVLKGTVPATVATFSELHDYIDANELGALCDVSTWPAMAEDEDGNADPEDHAAWMAEIATVQDTVDAWIRAGRPS
jgi:hypothetical protein